jgi:Domain of unknown function (DUF834).
LPANGGTRTQTEDTGTKRATRRTYRRPKRRRRGNGRRRRRGGNDEALRVDDGDDAPAVFDGGEGADEDGDGSATTMTTFPSDGDGWNDGGARWSGGGDGGTKAHGARATPATRGEGEGGGEKRRARGSF